MHVYILKTIIPLVILYFDSSSALQGAVSISNVASDSISISRSSFRNNSADRPPPASAVSSGGGTF